MKTITRNSTTYFPMGDTFASFLLLGAVFTQPKSSRVFRVNEKDFGNNTITAFNIENKKDTITLAFISPVTQFKKF